jgi:hypothetical protein
MRSGVRLRIPIDSLYGVAHYLDYFLLRRMAESIIHATATRTSADSPKMQRENLGELRRIITDEV